MGLVPHIQDPHIHLWQTGFVTPSILLTTKQFLASLSQFNLNSRENSCLLVRTCPSSRRKP